MLVALNSVGKITKVSKSTSYEDSDIAGNPPKLGNSKRGICNLVIG
jgi:hypothetical protein